MRQQFPVHVQEELHKIRAKIKAAEPEVEEMISYGMPAYKANKKPLVYFAAYKNPLGCMQLPPVMRNLMMSFRIINRVKMLFIFRLTNLCPMNF